MKKIALLLVLALCLPTFCFAATSITKADLYAQPEDSILLVVTTDEAFAEVDTEIEKIKTTVSFDDYFNAVDENEEKVQLADIEELQPVTVYEFFPIEIKEEEKETEKEYEDEETIVVNVPTVYDVGERVIVLIGINTEENGEENIKWYAFEGVGVDGGVQLTLKAEFIELMAAKGEFMAIASKTKY